MDLSNFRIVELYDSSGDLVGYKVFTNPEAAEKFCKLYNERYGDNCAYANPLKVYDSVMDNIKNYICSLYV